MDWLAEHAEAIGSFVAGLVTGGGAGWFITIKHFKSNVSAGRNAVDMRNATAGGDNVAGNKTTLGGHD